MEINEVQACLQHELITANETALDGVWFQNFMSELGFPQHAPTTLYIDNRAAVKVANNPELHSRMRHLDINYHWLRDMVEAKVFSPQDIDSIAQRADIFTKALPPVIHKQQCHLLGLRDMPSLW